MAIVSLPAVQFVKYVTVWLMPVTLPADLVAVPVL